VILAELSLFTGLAIVAPRVAVDALLRRPEVRKHGIYILSGTDTESGEPIVYVGETDNLARRISQHGQDVDMAFFERICVIASKDENLTKGHCLYLESRLISSIRAAGRVRVLNVKGPPPKGLPEPDVAEMEGFFELIGTILPLVGFDVLRPQPIPGQPMSVEAIAAFYAGADIFHYDIGGASARMQVRGGEYVVISGSTAVLRETPTLPSNIRIRRAVLSESGVLVEDNGFWKFTEDTGFKSASAASAAISGRSDNGLTSWRLPGGGQSLGDWQDSRVQAVSGFESDESDLEPAS
jgi:hypothetical protein